MPHYVAIIEETDPEAVSLWFPDLPGCISGGDDVDEALEAAPDALEFYAQELSSEGRELPPPRTLEELKATPEFADDLRDHRRPDRMASPPRRHRVRTVRRTGRAFDHSRPNSP